MRRAQCLWTAVPLLLLAETAFSSGAVWAGHDAPQSSILPPSDLARQIAPDDLGHEDDRVGAYASCILAK